MLRARFSGAGPDENCGIGRGTRSICAVAGLAALAAAVAAGAGCAHAGRAARAPERVLLITLDTTRADRLGAYGYGAASTPALDRLAASGVRFETVVAPTPITLPSHATILTGTYPVRHGVRNNGTYRLGSTPATLAERFQAAGYRTAAFLGSAILDSRYGLARGFDHYDDEMPVPRGRDRLFGERPAAEVTRRALEWLGREGGERWLVWVHYFDPHYEYAAPEPFAARFADRPYDGELAYVDAAVATLLDTLASRYPPAGTLVAVTADHGESLGEHGERSHGVFIYGATMRVPLILSWSGVLPSGRVVRGLASLTDLAPTLIDLAGLEPLPASQGRSLLTAMARRRTDDAPVLLESWLPRLNYGWSELVAVQQGRYKLIRAPRSELYDLQADPHERDNRIAREPAVAEEYAAKLGRLLSAASVAGSEAPAAPRPLDADAERLLRSLGYLAGGTEEAAPGSPPQASGGGSLADPKDKIGEFLEASEALLLLSAGRLDEAVQRLEAAERSNPGSVFIQRHLGNAYRHQGRMAEAEKKLRAAVRLSPDNPGALADLATLILEGGSGPDRAREAEPFVRRALQQNPELGAAHHLLGVVRERLRDPGGAIAAYRRALELEPHNMTTLGNLAILLEKGGREEEALALYRIGIEADPENARMPTSAAWILFRRRETAEAARLLRRAAEIDAASPKPLLALAEVLRAAGDESGALQALREAARREKEIRKTRHTSR